MAKEFSKKKGLKALLGSAVCAGALVFSSGAQALNVFVDWDGDLVADSNHSISVGDTATANFYASGLPAGGLNGYGLEVTYGDSAIFTAGTPVSNTAGIASFAPTQTDPLQMSGLRLSILGQPPVTTDPLLLFSVDYTGVSAGVSSFTLSHRSGAFLDFIDSLNNEIPASSINYLSSSLTITATPVPVPAAFWLLGSGILGFFGFSRKRA